MMKCYTHVTGPRFDISKLVPFFFGTDGKIDARWERKKADKAFPHN